MCEKDDTTLITVNGGSLQPHLEMMWWEILEAIQNRHDQDEIEPKDLFLSPPPPTLIDILIALWTDVFRYFLLPALFFYIASRL